LRPLGNDDAVSGSQGTSCTNPTENSTITAAPSIRMNQSHAGPPSTGTLDNTVITAASGVAKKKTPQYRSNVRNIGRISFRNGAAKISWAKACLTRNKGGEKATCVADAAWRCCHHFDKSQRLCDFRNGIPEWAKNKEWKDFLNKKGFDSTMLRGKKRNALRLLFLREEGAFLIELRMKRRGEVHNHVMAYIAGSSLLIDNTSGQKPVKIENDDRDRMRENNREDANGCATKIVLDALPKGCSCPDTLRIYEISLRL